MSYQLLLVDDEAHAIEGVKSDLDLDKLQIGSLYTARNIRKAKEVLEREKIDIMLCDIEMPHGSGLELLYWIREHQPHVVTIFLTSHADFKYAKEALQLGSLDYLLKPVLATELENAIRKAQELIDRNCEISRNSQSHQLWMNNHSFIIEKFWLDLINQSIPSHPSAIREQVDRHHIPVTEESVFVPVLISVQRWNKELKSRDEKILEYALLNSAEEIIIGKGVNGNCFELDRGMLLVILVTSRGTDWDQDRLLNACRQYIESCNRYFYCDLTCYVGHSVEVHEMAAMVKALRIMDFKNVAYANEVFLYCPIAQSEQPFELPALSSVLSLLKTATKEKAIEAVDKLLDNLVCNQEIDADILHRFNQDFVQVLYSFLNARGIQAHQLLGDEISRRISDLAGRSITDMKIWVRHAVHRATNQADAFKETDSIVKTIKRFIAMNIDQDLSRETIAEQVYMNPSYLSKFFKKETGYSLSDYVLVERINQAKELLTQTKVSISSIAASVGYTHFSHFSKIFKKYVGIGPTEYRSQSGES